MSSSAKFQFTGKTVLVTGAAGGDLLTLCILKHTQATYVRLAEM